ncbi:MAG TPA: biotin--[acetyl-CoA-carboxylase] ligase [Nitrospiraceae bacterium]|nr:biotin--[acetyl-CoA-carboxylase] ligase [Nitrospiraceae bacterium]
MPTTEPLDVERLQAALVTSRIGRLLMYVASTESTNADAVRYIQGLADAAVPHGMTIVSECQRAGRGRRGRRWHSPAEGNIYCSIILAPNRQLSAASQALSWTPLAAALAAADSLARYGASQALVKWPNDVMVNGKKVGGILCEQAMTPDKQPAIIVGLGLNVNGEPASMPTDIRATTTSLAAELKHSVDRAALLADLFLHLERRWDRLWSEGPDSVAMEFRQRCDTIGKQVRITFSEQEVVEGLALAIGDDGHLKVLVQSDDCTGDVQRIIEVRSADVVHLRGSRNPTDAGDIPPQEKSRVPLS